MEYIILLLTVVLIAAVQIIRKNYDLNHPSGGIFAFCALTCFFGAVFFFCSNGFKFEFCKELIPYSIAFSLSYGSSIIFSYFAIQCGQLSITSLITSYSLVIPTLYAVICLEESIGPLFIIGFCLLLLSLYLIGYRKKCNDTKTGISLKWVIYVTIAFIGNGLCSTIQTAQQRHFLGLYKNELMITSLTIVFIFLAIFALYKEKNKIIITLKKGTLYAFAFGILNGFVNLFVMILSGGEKINASIVFPTISAGGIITTVLASVFLYKEKHTKSQFAAMCLGTFAVVLMNL